MVYLGPTESYPEPVHEVRLIRVRRAPTCLRFHRLRRWRWDVNTYTPRVTTRAGIYDGRNGAPHAWRSGFGYTLTRWGALRHIGRLTARHTAA